MIFRGWDKKWREFRNGATIRRYKSVGGVDFELHSRSHQSTRNLPSGGRRCQFVLYSQVRVQSRNLTSYRPLNTATHEEKAKRSTYVRSCLTLTHPAAYLSHYLHSYSSDSLLRQPIPYHEVLHTCRPCPPCHRQYLGCFRPYW